MRKPRSEEAKQNMSVNHADVNGENNPMYGKKFTEEHKKKISKSLIGKMVGIKNPMYGRKRSGENAGNRKKVLQLSLDGEILNEFINITEASKETGAIRQHISKCCKGERKQTGGYKWVYVT
ncbi:NUMOD3 domain-containing DNA-binding protein [Bacillus wiedmannii]|nr:NUMOD3 domain-containing DNA-binding protein [Bacillus wiedmannii]